MVASNLQQRYDLPAGATLTITWDGDRPITTAELELLTRLASTVERSTVLKGTGEG